MDKFEEVKKIRHDWAWDKPLAGFRQCRRCTLVLSIAHTYVPPCQPLNPKHELILECCGKPESECKCEPEPRYDESPMYLDADGQWKLKPKPTMQPVFMSKRYGKHRREDPILTGSEPKPDESRLLTDEELEKAIWSRWNATHLRAAKAQLAKDMEWEAKTASIKDAENKELGLLLESRVGGVDEINDWSDAGLRAFRKQVLSVIKEHCKKLKAGDLGILYKYLDEKDAECHKEMGIMMAEHEAELALKDGECQQRIERIFQLFRDRADICPILPDDVEAIRKQEIK